MVSWSGRQQRWRTHARRGLKPHTSLSSRGQGIDVEELNAVSDAVFDEHAAGVELDQAGGRPA